MKQLKTKRSAIVLFLLNSVTFGIYGIILAFQLVKETNHVCAEDQQKTMNPIGAYLLGLITFGIYFIIWQVSILRRQNNYIAKKGSVPNLTSTLFWLAFFFGVETLFILPIIVYFKRIHNWNLVNKLYNKDNAVTEEEVK